MAAIRGKDTKPEMTVRRLIHGMGYRYRLHRKELPGKPDIVFVSRRAVIFVHGCYWHQHPDPACKSAHVPKSNLDFWNAKFDRNKARDERHRAALEAQGWRVLTIWECEVKDLSTLAEKIKLFLTSCFSGISIS